jgi:hypothetical protein
LTLTAQLRTVGSPVRKWMDEALPQVPQLAKSLALDLPAGRSPLVALPDGIAAGTVGTAFDYRLRYFFQVTPSQNLMAQRGTNVLVSRATDRGADQTRGLADLSAEFLRWTDKAVPLMRPCGRLLESDDERLLGQICWALALLEQVARAPREALASSPLNSLTDKSTIEDLLRLAPPPAVDDLAALADGFFHTQRDLVVKPAVLNPKFAGSRDVGGADADLIVDGTLIDVKVTSSLRMDPAWVRQILGYALLDYDDEYRILAAGLYLARHFALVSWPIERLLTLAGAQNGQTLAELRTSFRETLAREREQPAIFFRVEGPSQTDPHPSTKDVIGIGEAAELTGRTQSTIRRAIADGRLVPVGRPSGPHPAGYGSGFRLRREEVQTAFPPKGPHTCCDECFKQRHVTYISAQREPETEDIEPVLRQLHGVGGLRVDSCTRSKVAADGLPRITRYRHWIVIQENPKGWQGFRVEWTNASIPTGNDPV